VSVLFLEDPALEHDVLRNWAAPASPDTSGWRNLPIEPARRDGPLEPPPISDRNVPTLPGTPPPSAGDRRHAT
jgi:hypothetical protein